MNNANRHTNNQYVVFKLDSEYFALPINYVETIEKISEITRVPNAPHYIEGVINLRGEVVPVIDLRKRLKLNEGLLTDESRIIMVSLEEMIVGIMVDSSSEVILIENEQIDNTSNFVNSFEDDYIRGIGKIDQRMIIIIDIYKVLGVNIENE